MKSVLIAVGIFVATGSVAGAQTPGPAVEAVGGWAGFRDESIIHHSVAGARFRLPVSTRITAGPEVLFMKGPREDRDVFLQGVATFDFTEGRGVLTPYAIGSIGLMWHRSQFGKGPNNPGLQTAWSRHLHGSGGVGLRSRVGDRARLGAEARIGAELELTLLATAAYEIR